MQYSFNHATPLALRTTLIHWFQAHTLFRHAMFPLAFRLQVRRMASWISLQSSTSTGNTSTSIRTHGEKHFDYRITDEYHEHNPDYDICTGHFEVRHYHPRDYAQLSR